jgi:AcrR family transcriptional regulator
MAKTEKTEPGERPRRVRDPVSTRARIVEAAERLFAERGFESVSMPAIAAAAGITPGAIYKHFAGKTELFFHVIRRAVEAAPSQAGKGGIAGIPAAVAAYSGRSQKRLRQMALEVHAAATRHEDVRRLLRASVDRDIDAMTEGFEEAQADGRMEDIHEPEYLAAAMMVFIMGQMHLETLAPQLVGDRAWRAFVTNRMAALLGLRDW